MQKREARIAVSEQALVRSGANSFPCTLVNMSDNSFLIKCSKTFPVGQALDFSCELYPGKTLNCKIEVRYAGPAGIGAKIVEIDERGVRLCSLYLQEQYSNKLGRH